MVYEIAEKFKSLQGEGVYAGTPMAFIRFVGCSVGKTICHHCDTDFDKTMPWRGGGKFNVTQLLDWAAPYDHICLTGGEPLDQDLTALILEAHRCGTMVHIETSGTKEPDFHAADDNALLSFVQGALDPQGAATVWLCVSPKPGYIEGVVREASEIKVIVPGLGNGPGWPQLEDAIRWAEMGKIVYLQPRNGKFDVDKANLLYVTDLLRDYPQLRLSVQMHKILKVQ